MSIIDAYEYESLREVFNAAVGVASELPSDRDNAALTAIAEGHERDGRISQASARLILAVRVMKEYAGY